MATTRKTPTRKKPAAPSKPTVAPVKKAAPAAPKAVVPAPHPDKHVEPAVVVAPVKGKRVHGKFSMPKADYALIDELKKLAKKNGQPVRKNELLRAGLRALRAMDALALRGAITAVRPAADTAQAKPNKGKAKSR